MELSFADARVQDLCSSQDALVKEYGAALARKICCRLALLVAAPSLACVPMTLPIGLTRIGTEGRFSVALGVTHQLEFQGLIRETAVMTDLSQISNLLITGLVARPAATAARG